MKRKNYYTTIGVIFSASILLCYLFFYVIPCFYFSFSNNIIDSFIKTIQLIPLEYSAFIVTILLIVIVPVSIGYIIDIYRGKKSSSRYYI